MFPFVQNHPDTFSANIKIGVREGGATICDKYMNLLVHEDFGVVRTCHNGNSIRNNSFPRFLVLVLALACAIPAGW